MEFLKHFFGNIIVLAVLFGVMVFAVMAEGRFGHCSLEAALFIFAVAVTIISALVCLLASRALIFVRCATIVIFGVFVYRMIAQFALNEHRPDILGDISKYWIGAVVSILAIALQTFINWDVWDILIFASSRHRRLRKTRAGRVSLTQVLLDDEEQQKKK